MSGGSWNYLCYVSWPEVSERMGDITAMGDRLAREGYEDAAMLTHELAIDLQMLRVRTEAKLRNLTDVWQAVEWWDSGDSGSERLRDAVERMRTNGGKG